LRLGQPHALPPVWVHPAPNPSGCVMASTRAKRAFREFVAAAVAGWPKPDEASIKKPVWVRACAVNVEA